MAQRAEPEHRLLPCGHSHRPELLTLLTGVAIINPGSVGCQAYEPTEPAHVSEQGSPHARYNLVEVGESGFDFEVRAASCRHERAARRA